MSHRVRIVCRPPTGAGFSLAGMPCDAAEADAAGFQRFRDVLTQLDTGVVLVEDTVFERLPEELRRRIERTALPLVVPFPGPAWAAPAEGGDAYILNLLRRVIGYRVRLT